MQSRHRGGAVQARVSHLRVWRQALRGHRGEKIFSLKLSSQASWLLLAFYWAFFFTVPLVVLCGTVRYTSHWCYGNLSDRRQYWTITLSLCPTLQLKNGVAWILGYFCRIRILGSIILNFGSGSGRPIIEGSCRILSGPLSDRKWIIKILEMFINFWSFWNFVKSLKSSKIRIQSRIWIRNNRITDPDTAAQVITDPPGPGYLS